MQQHHHSLYQPCNNSHRCSLLCNTVASGVHHLQTGSAASAAQASLATTARIPQQASLALGALLPAKKWYSTTGSAAQPSHNRQQAQLAQLLLLANQLSTRVSLPSNSNLDDTRSHHNTRFAHWSVQAYWPHWMQHYNAQPSTAQHRLLLAEAHHCTAVLCCHLYAATATHCRCWCYSERMARLSSYREQGFGSPCTQEPPLRAPRHPVEQQRASAKVASPQAAAAGQSHS